MSATPGAGLPHDAATELREALRARALALGFVRVGFCDVEPLAVGAAGLADWLRQGRHGEMAYMAEQSERAAPRALLPEAKSVIVVALPHPRHHPDLAATPGAIARYARGRDHHLVMRDKLAALGEVVDELAGRPVLRRGCVDSAPLLERDLAAKAGVGFVGKSTLCIVPGIGTYVLLGELLLDLPLPPDSPATRRCARCDICVHACPTGAFVGPYVLDARRCISYLTIELAGAVPRELRPLVGVRVFGCDVCQEVCPFNRGKQPKPEAKELAPLPHLAAATLVDMLSLGAKAHRRFARETALRRITRHQLGRNAAVALGNLGDPATLPALVTALREHISPLVRGHAAWAVGRLGGDEAREALGAAREVERVASVVEELDEHRRVIGGLLALARLAVHPGAPAALGDDPRREHEVDA